MENQENQFLNIENTENQNNKEPKNEQIPEHTVGKKIIKFPN
jgi:hypothetical protein